MRKAYLHVYVDDWIKDYKSGLSTTKIAEKYKISRSTVQAYLSKKTKLRTISEANRGVNNPNWAGDRDISVNSLHSWVRRNKPMAELCEDCNDKPPRDLANISHTYNKSTYTRDFNNWNWLCRSCHMNQDGRIKNLKQGHYHNRKEIGEKA